MSKNRDRLSIIAAILEAASTGKSKTRIMYEANLSFKLLEKYLDYVLDAGFVRVDDSRYSLTESGCEYLKKYRSFNEKYFRLQNAIAELTHERSQLTRIVSNS